MGKQFKMDASTLLITFSVIFSFSNAQITVDENDRPNVPAEGDVDSRFFNIDFGNINLGGIAETALGTTLGNLGTGFLQDCLGIGKRSIIMDRLVNKRSAQEVTGEVTDADSRIISPQDVNERIFCTNNNNGYNGGGGFGGFGGKFFLLFFIFSLFTFVAIHMRHPVGTYSSLNYLFTFFYREQPTQLSNMQLL